jgi:hypothetical protein
MANKRALVNMACTCLGASEVFTQDREDLPEGMDLDGPPRRQSTKPDVAPTVARPATIEDAAPANTNGEIPSDDVRKIKKWISEKQEKRLYALLKSGNVTVESLKNWLKQKHNKDHLYQISWAGGEYEAICKTLEDKPEFFKAFEKGAASQSMAPENLNLTAMISAINNAAWDCGYEGDKMVKLLNDQWGLDSVNAADDKTLSIILDHFTALSDEANK